MQFLGFPLVPVLVALGWMLFSRFSLGSREKTLDETKAIFSSALVEKRRYEDFLKEFPQKQKFDLQKAFSSLKFLEELSKKIENRPLLNKIPIYDKKILEQEILFTNAKTKILSPYLYEEKSFQKPILMDQKNVVLFLKMVEQRPYDEGSFPGAGDLFFTYFHMKKTKKQMGTFYLVDAKITEKRGAI